MHNRSMQSQTIFLYVQSIVELFQKNNHAKLNYFLSLKFELFPKFLCNEQFQFMHFFWTIS